MAGAPTAHRRPPRLLGLPPRYTPIRRIARGGMSTLWCAEDTLLGRQVAIKLLSGALGDDADARRRFEREARAAASLAHPHVVTIFDVGETADGHDQPFIVMEYLEGGTVGEARGAAGVSRKRALRWLTEAAAALDFAHGRGVVHRDVKPGNLLLSDRDSIKVADFGIARISSEATITASGQLFGTAAYLSPEQAHGEPATPASDRYALAVVAYELLTGRRPFSGEGFAAQARGHMEEEPPAASSVQPRLPRRVDAVLARGLAKAPAARWPTCSAFAAALRDALAADAPAVEPAGQSATVPLRAGSLLAEPGRRAPRIAAAAALLAGLLVAAAIALLATGSGGGAPMRSATSGKVPARRAGRPAARRAVAAPVSSTSTTAASPLSAAAPASGASASADALEAQGHSLVNGGSPAAAVPVLRRAVAAASPGSLTYAYALYDLGHALRLAGDPAGAIPILEQRLRIPNQTGVVRQELALAEAAVQAGPAPAASGAAPAASNGGPAAPGGGHGRGHQKNGRD
jgi:eukaryotic-like serine/threonine-protein kinase